MKFRIVHVSDWHAYHDEAYDIMNRWFEKQKPYTRFDGPGLVVVTGDMVGNTRAWRYKDYVGEGETQYAHWLRIVESIKEVFSYPIVAVRGNHDYCDLAIPGLVDAFDTPGVGTKKYGKLVVSGCRGVPTFNGQWNDEYQDHVLQALVDDIPESTHLLLTHAPPYGILDNVNHFDEPKVQRADWQTDRVEPFFRQELHIGIFPLTQRLPKLKNLRAHCFGHVHECGRQVARMGEVQFSNASLGINVFDIEV